MAANLDLRADHLAAVLTILEADVPELEALVFGSRARWTASDVSDLDLALVGDRPLDLATVSRLQAAFEASNLPFSVDIVDWNRIDEEFREIIRNEGVVLRRGSRSGPWPHPDGWHSRTLGQAARFLSGGTPSKSDPALWTGPVPWASAKDLKSFYLWDTQDHISTEAVDSGSRLAPEGAIFVLTRGMTLHKDVPIALARRPTAFNQDIRAIIAREGIDSRFLAYALLGRKGQLLQLVDSASHGTGRILSSMLEGLPLAIPALPEQKAIAHILGTLDDKIELNRRQSETLEAMARAAVQAPTTTLCEGLMAASWQQQEHCEDESRTLAALRDALLPKLVSGELRVRDAERFLERAGV